MPATPQVTDTNDVPISYLSLALAEASVSGVIVIRFPAAAGQFLTAADNALVDVLARKNGSGDSFVNLFTDPIDLTPYDGTIVDFDLKLSTGSVTSVEHTSIPVRITYNP